MSFFTKLMDSFFGKPEDKYVRDYKGKNEFKTESSKDDTVENDDEQEEPWQKITLAEVLPKINDLVGIDISEAPNYEWKEGNSEYNTQNKLVRNYTLSATHRLSDYFYFAEAKVIGKEGTNFFFSSLYTSETLTDLYYFIEKELKKRIITLQQAAKELHEDYDSLYIFKNYQFEDFDIDLTRDLETEDLRLCIATTFYNGKYIDLKEAPKPKVPVVTPEGYTIPDGFENWTLQYKIEMAQLPFFNECLWMKDGRPALFGVIRLDGKIAAVEAETFKPVLMLEGDMFSEHLDKGETIAMICSDVKYGDEYLEMNAWFKFIEPSEDVDDDLELDEDEE